MARRSKNKAQANQSIIQGATYVTDSAPIADHQTTTEQEESETTANKTTLKITLSSTTSSIISPTTSTTPSNELKYTKDEQKKKDPLAAWASQISEEDKQLSNRKKYKLAAQLGAKEVESWANDEPAGNWDK